MSQRLPKKLLPEPDLSQKMSRASSSQSRCRIPERFSRLEQSAGCGSNINSSPAWDPGRGQRRHCTRGGFYRKLHATRRAGSAMPTPRHSCRISRLDTSEYSPRPCSLSPAKRRLRVHRIEVRLGRHARRRYLQDRACGDGACPLSYVADVDANAPPEMSANVAPWRRLFARSGPKMTMPYHRSGLCRLERILVQVGIEVRTRAAEGAVRDVVGDGPWLRVDSWTTCRGLLHQRSR